MNKWIGSGRLTSDPKITQISTAKGQMSIADFTLACNSKRKDAPANFIRCKALGTQADFVAKYFKTGMKMDACGEITTGSYTNKSGQKVYTWEVTLNDIEFGESKASAGKNQASTKDSNQFVNVPEDADDDGLPFS